MTGQTPFEISAAGREGRCVSAIDQLQVDIDAFLALEGAAREVAFYHRVMATIHHLCSSILACEENGLSRPEILQMLAPVREIHSRSPFVKRLQEWPRGYPGDYETVEYLCAGAEAAGIPSLEQMCETYALTRAIAQQHRNKVQHQASRILRTLLEHPGNARIFSVACGSCPDFRSLAPHLPALLGELWLNDGDSGALSYSLGALKPVADRCHSKPGNALHVARRAARSNERFDLVLAGGLFDYLPEKQAIYLIEQAWKLLKPGGVFFFTNIARGNPYRPMIEYIGDWFLIERSEAEVREYCLAAGIPRDAVMIRREETSLSLLIEVERSLNV